MEISKLKEVNPIAIQKYLARDFSFFVSDDSEVTWKTISGISEWTWTVDSNNEDVSDIDSGAWGSSLYTQRTGTLELSGFYLVESITGIRDQGQLTIEQAATKVGYSAYRNFRIEMTPLISGVKGTSMGGFKFQGQAALSDFGGNTTDVNPWGATILFNGKPTGSGVMNIF